jgi:hypothetical protein
VPTITEVCTAVAGAIDGITGLRAKPYADTIINEPDCHVFTREFDPRFVFGSTKHPMPMTARVFAKAVDARTAQTSLRSFMEPSGSTSVLAKIEGTTSWSGATVDYAEVTLISSPAQVEIAGTVRWFVDFEFDVVF